MRFEKDEIALLIDCVQTLHGELEGYPNEVYGDPEDMDYIDFVELKIRLEHLKQKLKNEI